MQKAVINPLVRRTSHPRFGDNSLGFRVESIAEAGVGDCPLLELHTHVLGTVCFDWVWSKKLLQKAVIDHFTPNFWGVSLQEAVINPFIRIQVSGTMCSNLDYWRNLLQQSVINLLFRTSHPRFGG